jgi:hypothetical protein
MNEIKVASDTIPGILRTIDEIAFHTSMLALNAAVAAADEAPAQSLWNAQAASDTLALIEESITCTEAAARPAATYRETGTDVEALRGVAERLRRMRCAPARVSVHQARPFSDAR